MVNSTYMNKLNHNTNGSKSLTAKEKTKMSYTKKEREQYNENRDRACSRLGITVNQYNFFRRKGNLLHGVYENNCNGLIKESDYIRSVEAFEEVLISYSKDLGLSIYFQTDPRGATIYLDKVAIPENNYTQAVCIY